MTTSFRGKKIWVAGHNGMVGSAILRQLQDEDGIAQTVSKGDLDLTRQADVERWMFNHRPDIIFIAAARVGGIYPNAKYPAEFIYDNVMIEANIINAAHKIGVEKLLFLGSSCMYPKDCKQPMREEMLLSGRLEPTNEAYAMAKLLGLKLCQAYHTQYNSNFITAIPTNLYGINDNYHPENAHVPAALMQRIHTAKTNGDDSVTIWGTGQPKREFMCVDDLARACVFLMKNYNENTPINIGSGLEMSINELANQICEVIGFTGEIKNDLSKPDGVTRKLIDSSKIQSLGWAAQTDIKDGLKIMYQDYLSKYARHQGTYKKRA